MARVGRREPVPGARGKILRSPFRAGYVTSVT
jgi:hypothetical protein